MSTPSLELILAGQESSPYSQLEFTNFLRRCHCYENYEFIQQLDQLRRLHGQKQLQQQLWYAMINKFVNIYSDNEINLTGDVRGKLLKDYDELSKEKWTLVPQDEVLSEAKDETYLLLQDAYIQFLKSVSNKEDNKVYVKPDCAHEHGFASVGNYCMNTRPSESCSSPLSSSRSTLTDLEIPGLDDYIKKQSYTYVSNVEEYNYEKMEEQPKRKSFLSKDWKKVGRKLKLI